MWSLPKSISHWFRVTAKIGFVLIIGAIIFYKVALAPISVETVEVGAGTVVAEVMGTGTLEPRVRVAISPKITGFAPHFWQKSSHFAASRACIMAATFSTNSLG